MRGGRYNWPSFTLDEERALAEKARRMNGKNENGSTEGGFEKCAEVIEDLSPEMPEDAEE
jgi:hypothetical protein